MYFTAVALQHPLDLIGVSGQCYGLVCTCQTTVQVGSGGRDLSRRISIQLKRYSTDVGYLTTVGCLGADCKRVRTRLAQITRGDDDRSAICSIIRSMYLSAVTLQHPLDLISVSGQGYRLVCSCQTTVQVGSGGRDLSRRISIQLKRYSTDVGYLTTVGCLGADRKRVRTRLAQIT